MKIFIDQGHNPQNPNAGAEGNGVREQDINYAVGMELAKLLRSNSFFEVKLSRNSPDEILGTSNSESLALRTSIANSWGADYFISLHCNSSDIESASGSEAFVYSTGSVAYQLAEDILQRLNEATGLENRGVYLRPSLYVLRNTDMPALLLEMGFISNPYDARLMSDNPSLFARGIYNGILEYFGLR